MSNVNVTMNLVGGSRKGKYPSQQGSDWSMNMYPEKNDSQQYMCSVPGLKYISQVVSDGSAFRGCYVASSGLTSEGGQQELFAVYGSTLYRYDQSITVHAIGTINSLTTRVSFAESGGPRPFLYLVDGTGFYYYNIGEGGSLTQATLPEPVDDDTRNVKPTHIAVVGGIAVINDAESGYAYYTNAYPLASDTRTVYEMANGAPVYESADSVKIKTIEVSSASYMWLDDYGVQHYFNAESSSDKISAVYAMGSALYLFGPTSVEIWQRGSDSYATWIRTSYTINTENGLAETYSITSVNNSLIYVASGKSMGKCVMGLSGTTFERISQPWLDAKLLQATEIYGFSFSTTGHNFFVLQMSGLNETWVYDAANSQWHQNCSLVYATGRLTSWRVAGMAWWRQQMLAFTTDGFLESHMNDYYYEDFSSTQKLPMVRKRQTPVVVDDYKPFIFNEMSVECNVGAFDGYYETDPFLLLEVSSDGGNTFGNAVQESLGRTGQYSARVRFLGLGLNRLCVVRITYSNPTDFVVTASSNRVTATEAPI